MPSPCLDTRAGRDSPRHRIRIAGFDALIGRDRTRHGVGDAIARLAVAHSDEQPLRVFLDGDVVVFKRNAYSASGRAPTHDAIADAEVEGVGS